MGHHRAFGLSLTSFWISCCLLAVSTRFAPGDQAGVTITAAAQQYLATLTEEQKATARLPYDTPQRVGWHYIPKEYRKGLQIKQMRPAQRTAAFQLLRGVLSEVGYGKATKIMALEAILRELEKSRRSGPLRDPERYYYTLFGEPSDTSRWGLSIEGHHLSLNFVVVRGRVAASTPTFLGSNPAIVDQDVPGAPPRGTRVLAREETLAFELLQMLDADQRRVAVLSAQAPRDIRNPDSPHSPPYAAEGLGFAQMKPDQQQKLLALIAEYAKNLPDDVAHHRLDEIAHAGYEKIYFAWAGADRPGIGHAYRIQGPTFLIEFVNNQPDAAGRPASHIHSVWRDPRGDFALAPHHDHD